MGGIFAAHGVDADSRPCWGSAAPRVDLYTLQRHPHGRRCLAAGHACQPHSVRNMARGCPRAAASFSPLAISINCLWISANDVSERNDRSNIFYLLKKQASEAGVVKAVNKRNVSCEACHSFFAMRPAPQHAHNGLRTLLCARQRHGLEQTGEATTYFSQSGWPMQHAASAGQCEGEAGIEGLIFLLLFSSRAPFSAASVGVLKGFASGH